ncbi:hypothetical protein DIZ27_25950 [Streptomyces sp. NWU339]|uniref:hypothetical protein n=1 Tax=Streptomyces sp. NWU339 TaxID=2185284 RepID=UPI000D67ED58|nr:hypothetical protein [Streptomyces sp. NWU339]PWI07874.1 hypothetical protein DIZ27_25950 [Streptomyces sp. NWU339]
MRTGADGGATTGIGPAKVCSDVREVVEATDFSHPPELVTGHEVLGESPAPERLWQLLTLHPYAYLDFTVQQESLVVLPATARLGTGRAGAVEMSERQPDEREACATPTRFWAEFHGCPSGRGDGRRPADDPDVPWVRPCAEARTASDESTHPAPGVLGTRQAQAVFRSSRPPTQPRPFRAGR